MGVRIEAPFFRLSLKVLKKRDCQPAAPLSCHSFQVNAMLVPFRKSHLIHHSSSKGE